MRGNNWLIGSALVVTLSLFADDPSLELDVTSLDGDSLAIVGAGQPFVLRVTCSNMQGNCNEPIINGLDQVEVENKRFTMHTVGKQSTIIHSYTVRVDIPGSYIVGPASVKDNTGQIIKSEAFALSVGSSHARKKKVSKNKHYAPKEKQPSYFLRVSTNTDTAYVGERVSCTLRLYHDKTITPQPAEQRSDLKKIGLLLFSDEVPPTYGEKELDGKRYGYYQWKFDIVPTKTGRLVLPAFNTLVPTDSSWPRSFFMAPSLQRIYSNAVAFNILPVECDPPVDLVGRFSSLTATVNPGAARQGNAMTLTVELEGDKNVANLDHFTVKNIPSGLRMYESAQRVEPSLHGRSYVKQLEFVLHGIESGEWEIPEQSLTYFDLTDCQCKTLVSPSLLVTVLPGHQAQGHQEAHNGSDQSEQEPKELIRDIFRSNQASHRKAYLPWWLFILFLLPLCILPVVKTMKKIYLLYGIGYVSTVRRWLAFMNVRRHIRSVQRTGSCEQLYGIVIRLFAIRTQTTENSITKEVTVQVLRSKGLDSTLVSQWSSFFYELERASFKDTGDSSCYELCTQSLRWISIIEKVL